MNPGIFKRGAALADVCQPADPVILWPDGNKHALFQFIPLMLTTFSANLAAKTSSKNQEKPGRLPFFLKGKWGSCTGFSGPLVQGN
jgi:hypothetical protein